MCADDSVPAPVVEDIGAHRDREVLLAGASVAGDEGVPGRVHGDVVPVVAVSPYVAAVDENGRVDDKRQGVILVTQAEAINTPLGRTFCGWLESAAHFYRYLSALCLLEGDRG